jgi:hypothetical protein
MKIGRRDFMKYVAEGFVLAGSGLFVPKAYADVAPHKAYSDGQVFKLSEKFPFDPKSEITYGEIPANRETGGLYFVDYGKIADACPSMKKFEEKKERGWPAAQEIAKAEVKEWVPREVIRYGEDHKDTNNVQMILYMHLLKEKGVKGEDLFEGVPKDFKDETLDQIVKELDISDDVIKYSSSRRDN